jgi:transcriptional regulator with XRE-family HTH domain
LRLFSVWSILKVKEEQAMQKLHIGKRIRKVREKQGMTQVALARALGASINAINMLEMGSTKAPHIERLVAIADILGVSLDYLAGRTEDPTAPQPPQPKPKRVRTRQLALMS